MKIEKEIKSKIERDYFFVEGSLENIDSDYFINKMTNELPNFDDIMDIFDKKRCRKMFEK